MLIDCDIHVTYTSLRELAPYADAHTRELIERSGVAGLSMPTYPWVHPSGWIRRDTYDAAAVEAGSMFPGFTLDQLRDHVLDRFGVTFAVANPDEAASFSVLPNTRLAAGLASAYNDWLLDRWLRHEPRLHGALVVPAQWPEAAAREIRRMAPSGRFAAVFLPGAARIPYGNPVYDPIWEAAAETGLPVAIHVHYEGVGTSGPLTGAGMPDFYTEFHTLNGASLQGHLVSILCHGTFERHPEASAIFMEGGLVGYVGVLWRLDQNWRATRSEIPWCRRRPSEYVWDHVRFTTQPLEEPDDPQQLAAVLAPLQPERTLMYATDYPHWDFDDPDQTLRTLPAAWQEPIRHGTAASLFGVPVTAAA
jgi:predicted TIM-barrel fold metal-dependent hydrolase